LKNVDANSDSDDSFDDDKKKPGSEILSIVSNPDLDNFKEVKYDTPASPPSILRWIYILILLLTLFSLLLLGALCIKEIFQAY